MTKRQFLLGVFILMTVLLLGGTGGYFYIQSRKLTVEQNLIEAEINKYKADKKTERTKERWSFLPDFRGNKDEN